jgi:Ankyrin repeats (3 copies)
MHHELSSRLDLEWYRKQAKDLVRGWRAGSSETRERVEEILGERADRRFRLGDAQWVIAREHGFRSWADFARWIEGREPEPPVGRIGREPLGAYEERARLLAAGAAAGDEDALRRVRAHLPSGPTFGGGPLALHDAKVVVAREYGFPTWRALAFYVAQAIHEHEGQRDGAEEVLEALAAIRAGDVARLEALLDRRPQLTGHVHRGAWTTLLEAIAQPDVVGDDLGAELGVDARVVELLVERGSELEAPLNLAACFNRAELVRILLDAGADALAAGPWGTALQTAIYHGSREAGDVLAPRGLVPGALYVAAGTGRLDALEEWFEADGSLRQTAFAARPNLADVGWPPAPPPRDEPQEVLDEAFALAAFNGRREAMAVLLERGASVDGRAHGLTALHFAVAAGRLDVVRWLLDHGADPALRDAVHRRTAVGWAGGEAHRGGHARREIRDLLVARSAEAPLDLAEDG